MRRRLIQKDKPKSDLPLTSKDLQQQIVNRMNSNPDVIFREFDIEGKKSSFFISHI